MDIIEATRIAVKSGKWIARNVKGVSPWNCVQIKPTNTSDGCIVKPRKELKHRDGVLPRRGWQPSADDLIADDWIVID